jgi:type IV fimbrial biogenesis protein FimT
MASIETTEHIAMTALAPRRIRGITLIEMMMSLTLAAILLATAAPVFGTLIGKTQGDTSRGAITASLETARLFAISRSAHVVACPSADQQYCGHTTEWQHGWIVFVDADHNGDRDVSETIIAATQSEPAGVAILSSAGRTHVDFRPDGSSPGSNATFTVCDAAGAAHASAIVINNAGRLRTGAPSVNAAAACVASLGPA